MKLYARIINEHEVRTSWDNVPDRFDEEGKKIDYDSPHHRKADGWYEISREPELEEAEHLTYNAEKDCIEIKVREMTPAELAQEEGRAKIAELRTAYPQERVLELQDAAIAALAAGDPLPAEYQEYQATRSSIFGVVKEK